MKRSALTIVCALLVAFAIAVPFALQNRPSPEGGDNSQQLVVVSDEVATAAESATSSLAVEYSEYETDDPDSGLEYDPNTVLVGIADGISIEEVNRRLASYDFITTKSVSEDDLIYGYALLDLAEGVPVKYAVDVLEQADFVSAAQPDYIYHVLDETPSGAADIQMSQGQSHDASPNLQIGASTELTAQSTGINDPYSSAAAADEENWMLKAINAYRAWDYSRANGSVTVAVLDSGVNANHDDLKDNLVAVEQPVFSSVNDDNGHGTHVAGIIAAEANNAEGVAGVSYNAKIMPVKVINSGGGVYSHWAAAGVDYAVAHKDDDPSAPVRVINMSFGGANPAEALDEDNADENDLLFMKAIDDAQAADILVVCAAGNNATSAYKCFPCDFDEEILGVINLTHSVSQGGTTYSRAYGSNYNMSGQATKEISAPGTGIYSTVIDSQKENGQPYGHKSGTSMATPCVSGVAALMFAANPSLSAAEAKQILCQTAVDLNKSANLPFTKFDYETGYGMVDAAAALNAVAPDASPAIAGSANVGKGGTAALSIANDKGGGTWAWSSAVPGIATVDPDTGVVSGVSEGQAIISAAKGDITLSKTVNVYDPTIIGNDTMEYGTSQTLSVSSANPPGTWSVSSSDTSVARFIGTGGTLSALKPGTTTVTFTLSGTSISSTKNITVTPADIANATMTMDDQVYTGEALQPTPSVALSGRSLTRGADYDIAYENNMAQGTASYTITGKGNYEGTKSGTFRIGGASIKGASLAGTGSYTYTGSEVEVTDLVVQADTTETLQEGRDYTVSYKNNVNAGAATVTVTGIGNYVDSTTAYFLIQPKDIRDADVTVSGVSDKTYTGSALGQSPTIQFNGKTLVEGTDYTLSYSNNTNAGAASMTITGKGNFEPYTYSWNTWFGVPYYNRTAKSAPTGRTVGFTINRASISAALVSADAQTYTGGALTPAPRVVLNGKVLSAVTDYAVSAASYSNNVNAGTATVTVVGSGNYDGFASGTFAIGRGSLSGATVTPAVSDYTYDGAAKTPDVTVVANGKTLVRNGDYTVSYYNNVSPGTATVEVIATANGNYAGSKTATFTISEAALESFAGSNRYDTAKKIALAECALPGASYEGVIVCSCNEGKFPDALSAAGLSGVLGYPVVAVNGVGLEWSDREALAAMQSRCPSRSLNILVVGGEATVSAAVRAELSAYGRVSFPFAGADRYETNRLIYEYGAAHGGWSISQAFIASGANFPDAMTIAPYLVWAKCPIVLVDPSASSLSPAQRSAVAGAAQVVALGGSASVPERLLTQAASASARGSSLRLGGATRYETSAAIVEWELGRGMTLEGAGFATGQAFPDALASSFLLGSRGSVLGLVSPSGNNPNMLSAVSAAAARKGVPSTMRVFGGIASVPTSVRNQLAQAAGWPSWNAASS